MSRKLAALLITQLVLGCALPEALAQDAMTLERVRSLGLETLPDPVPTYHSHGARPRAEAVQRRVRDAVSFFESRYGIPSSLSLAVLNEPHWAAVSQGPYGAGFASEAPRIVVWPASPESGIVAQVIRTAHAAVPSRKVGQSWADIKVSHEAAVGQVLDAILVHEVAHVYVNGALGFRDVARWFNEFMATYMAYAFLHSREPAVTRMWDAASADIAYGIQPSTRRLDDFNRLSGGLGIETYGWFQSNFNLGVTAVLAETKDADWFKQLRAAGLDKDSGSLTTSELLDRLDRITPGLKQWAEKLQAAP